MKQKTKLKIIHDYETKLLVNDQEVVYWDDFAIEFDENNQPQMVAILDYGYRSDEDWFNSPELVETARILFELPNIKLRLRVDHETTRDFPERLFKLQSFK